MKLKIATAMLASSALWSASAHAQAGEIDLLREQVSAMQAEITRLSERIDQLQTLPAATPAAPDPVPAVSPAPPPPVQIAWRGAPEITGEGGWSFKPRGRLQIDAGTVLAPAGINDASTGFGSEIRRAFLGAEGKLPGGFAYRAEIDIATSAVEITDLYLTYQASPELTLMVGQTKPFWGLEEGTSDLFTSFTERAAFNSALGHERRLGINAVYASGPVILQAGVFTDNVADLGDDENNSYSVDGRLVFAPKIGESQLHLAGSFHLRDLNDSATTVRYRARPFIHTPDIRFIDTSNISANGENGYGLEAAWVLGRFHAAGEWRWQHVNGIGPAPNPTFAGGYAEAGLFLTHGDTRTYRGGVFDRIRPANPLDTGGIGAVQINLRYDYLDLADAGISGGVQNAYLASLIWTPTAYTRLMLNYGRLVYADAAIAEFGGDRDYAADSFGMRAQVDF